MKRYVMEFIGTFFLTIAISLIGNPIAIGFILMAMIYIGGHISGAHFNPAISFACLIQHKLKSFDTIMYILAQSFGAVLALCIFTVITGNRFTLDIIPEDPYVGPVIIEALLVLVLCWIYLTMNFDKRYKDTVIPGIVMGLTLMAIASAGGIFNPAVAAASIGCNAIKESVSGDMSSLIVYIVGPLLGALGASFAFDYFKCEV